MKRFASSYPTLPFLNGKAPYVHVLIYIFHNFFLQELETDEVLRQLKYVEQVCARVLSFLSTAAINTNVILELLSATCNLGFV